MDNFQALAFPNLFPYGKGSFKPSTERLQLLKKQNQYNAFLLDYYDHQFLDPIFVFWTLNIMQCKRIARATVRAAEQSYIELVCGKTN